MIYDSECDIFIGKAPDQVTTGTFIKIKKVWHVYTFGTTAICGQTLEGRLPSKGTIPAHELCPGCQLHATKMILAGLGR